MRQMDSKEFAELVDDRIADEIYNMLVTLMSEFEEEDFVRELTPLEEAHVEANAEESAENLKESVYRQLVWLGLDVESDGREF